MFRLFSNKKKLDRRFLPTWTGCCSTWPHRSGSCRASALRWRVPTAATAPPPGACPVNKKNHDTQKNTHALYDGKYGMSYIQLSRAPTQTLEGTRANTSRFLQYAGGESERRFHGLCTDGFKAPQVSIPGLVAIQQGMQIHKFVQTANTHPRNAICLLTVSRCMAQTPGAEDPIVTEEQQVKKRRKTTQEARPSNGKQHHARTQKTNTTAASYC